MGKYSYDPDQSVESSKARGSALRAHFKHCREVCHNIKGMKLPKAKAYLEDVLQFKQAVSFTKFTGGCGRHAQGIEGIRGIRGIRGIEGIQGIEELH